MKVNRYINQILRLAYFFPMAERCRDDAYDLQNETGKSWIYVAWDNPYDGANSWGYDWFDYQAPDGKHQVGRFKMTLDNSPGAHDDDLKPEYSVSQTGY